MNKPLFFMLAAIFLQLSAINKVATVPDFLLTMIATIMFLAGVYLFARETY